MKEIKQGMPAHERVMWQSVADTLNEKAFAEGREPIYDADSAYAYSKEKKKTVEPKIDAKALAEKEYREAPNFASKDPIMLKAEYDKNLSYFNDSKISKSPEEAESMAMIKMIKPELKDAQEIRHFMGDSLESLTKAGTLKNLQHNITTTASHISNFVQVGLNRLTGDSSRDFGHQLDALKSTIDSMSQIHSETLGQRMQRGKLEKLDAMLDENLGDTVKNVSKKTI